MSSGKLSGPPLGGFYDYFDLGNVTIGASKPPPKASLSKTPKPPPKINVKPPHNPAVENHGKVLAAARHAAAKAVQSAHAALKAGTPRKRTTAVGAVAMATAAKTPKQKAAVAKHQAAMVKTDQAAKAAAAAGQKARAAAIDLAKKAKAQKAAAVKLRGGAKGKAHIGELLGNTEIGEAVYALLGEYYTEVGADPDPSNPGFLTDGTADPAYAAQTGPTDAAAADPSLTDLTADDSGTALPAAPDMGTYVPDLAAMGGILYNNEKGTPDGYCLSYGLATRKTDIRKGPDAAGLDGTQHFGYVFGRYNDEGPEKGIPWGSDLDSGVWNHVHGQHILAQKVQHDVVDFPVAMGSIQNNNPNGVSYGPLIGNPAMKDFSGMRVDASGRMGWFPQEAPDWLTFPLKQAAALTAQAAAKAAADAAAADAAAKAKAEADAAEAQAQQDAANALAESQEASAAKVAQSQADTQAKQTAAAQAQADQQTQAQTQQLLVQQAQQEQTQGAAEAEQYQQAGQLILEQARRRSDYMAQHPELEFAQGGGEDQGGDEGGGEDQGGDDGGGADDELSSDFVADDSE